MELLQIDIVDHLRNSAVFPISTRSPWVTLIAPMLLLSSRIKAEWCLFPLGKVTWKRSKLTCLFRRANRNILRCLFGNPKMWIVVSRAWSDNKSPVLSTFAFFEFLGEHKEDYYPARGQNYFVFRVFSKMRMPLSRRHRLSLSLSLSLSLWNPVTMSRRHRLSLWTPVTMSRRSSRREFRIVWLPKMPASGWGSLWESSSFVPWFVLNAFRDISGVVPEWPWISGFMRKSSFTWVKWVGNLSLYRNHPQNIGNIRMYSVLYPESNFWWVFRNGSGNVPYIVWGYVRVIWWGSNSQYM